MDSKILKNIEKKLYVLEVEAIRDISFNDYCKYMIQLELLEEILKND